jgi:hypothetical protein
MHITKGRVAFFGAVCAIYFAWGELSRTAHETVILQISGVGNRDTYATLWVVDDARNLWIRAESSERLWLDYLKDYPLVELHRDGRSDHYRAELFDTADARAYIDPIFRAKYGYADEVREILRSRGTIPIRLDRP